jgi:Na+-translocating ferredoxin:NAD+ oxidoreductase RnfG subunit
VINFRNQQLGAKAKPVSIDDITGTTVTPDAVENPFN